MAWILLATLAFLGLPAGVDATVLPSGFVETKVASDLVSPTASVHAPDGRIFVAEQDGRIRVVKNGGVLTDPLLQLEADNVYERGLLGIALDPSFTSNHFLYVYYNAADRGACRISRFVAHGDTADPDSETVIAELPPYNAGARYHFGGAMHFGPADGKLYLGVGDHSIAKNAQSLENPFGKILRFNRNGTIPSDNPFFDSSSGVARAIWAFGLRNPFTFALHRTSGRLLVGDVGLSSWEEIDEGVAGANYGWPASEGPTDDPAYVSPSFAYPRSGRGTEGGCAVTGTTFYAPLAAQFPAQYENGFFFADHCRRWIRWIDPVTDVPVDFATALTANPTDLDVGPDGSLYYLARPSGGQSVREGGAIYRISYTGSRAPQITAQPQSETVLVGDSVTFRVEALGADTFQWRRDDQDITGATADFLTLDAVGLDDDGTQVTVVATNDAGDTTSAVAVLSVTTNHAPEATIVVEAPRERFWAGDEIEFEGHATDAEDGSLSTASFTWRVDFHHNTHSHPYLPSVSGFAGGEFATFTSGETAADVWYRIHLRVTDSAGRSSSTSADVEPELSVFSLATNPPGLQVELDAQPRATPAEITGVVGLSRNLGAEQSQIFNGATYLFDRWSDAGAREHAIETPSAATTYTAYYRPLQTTTTTTTSTTLSPLCRNGVVDQGEDCDEGDVSFEAGDYCGRNCKRVLCGKPTGSRGLGPALSDALFTLWSAMGTASCDDRVCDVDGDGFVRVGDALRIMRAAVGLPIVLDCRG